MTRPHVTVSAPATVSNVACGFDVLGFALDEPRDTVTAVPRDTPGVEILEITGDGGRVTSDPARNTAGLAVQTLLRSAGSDAGVGLIIHKGIPPASGMGSSGASAVAAALASAKLLDLDVPEHVSLRAAMEGERAAAGAVHPDNVAPSFYGGFVLVRAIEPLDIVRIPVPAGLACAVLHPAIEVETRVARALLPEQVPLRDAVRQWANVGALVAALFASDLDLLSRALVDVIVEPRRAHLVPGFYAVQQAARDAGALGCSISGAGPSIFALCRSLGDARRVGPAMRAALQRHGALDGQVFVSHVGATGARVGADAVDQHAR